MQQKMEEVFFMIVEYYISSTIINKEVQSYPEYAEADDKSPVWPREEFTKTKKLKTRRMEKDKHHFNTFSYNGSIHYKSVCTDTCL